MSSLSLKDRVSLCSFTFSDGRRCRSPRADKHPRFCFYHAEKEARARAAETLGKDLVYFFSGDYLSACDLSTALARIIPAVVRGDVKPKTAHTVAYLAQTLMQSIHVSQHEYCEAFSSDAWRKSIRNSVNHNYNYRFPPTPAPAPPAPSAPRTNLRSQSPQPQPQPTQTPVICHSERSEESASSSNSSPATRHSPLPQASQPAASPHTALPPTSAEFVQRVVALSSDPSLATSHSPLLTQAIPAPAPSPATSRATQTPSSRACHPERSEGSCLDPAAPTTDVTHLVPATQAAQPVPSAPPPNNPPPAAPSTQPPVRNLDASAYHYHNGRLLIDGKPF